MPTVDQTTKLRLNNGVDMPVLGLGVFQTPPDETRAAVEAALSTGYRHIDTAAAYGNERQVGDAVRGSGLARDDVFLETKIWISDYGYDQTLHGFEKSAAKLGVDQIDLLILHQALPVGLRPDPRGLPRTGDAAGEGKVRAIGVSNFMVEHLDRLLERATSSRRSTRSRSTPTSASPSVQAADAEHGILTQAWSPIGGITFYRDGSHGSTLQDPVIGGIAARTARRRPR